MQNYEEVDADEFQQSAGGFWIRVVGIVVYMAIIVAYAIQTLQLVGWLFPTDNTFMKGVTVFVCDGCATGYAMADMFYRFKLRKSKNIVFGMWIITFILSTAASVIQIYLSSTHNIPHTIDINVITATYGLIIAAYVVNIIAITVVIRLEYNAGKPQHHYLDDGGGRRLLRQTQKQQAGFFSRFQRPGPRQAPAQTSQSSTNVLTDETTGKQYTVSPDGKLRPLAPAPSNQQNGNGAH